MHGIWALDDGKHLSQLYVIPPPPTEDAYSLLVSVPLLYSMVCPLAKDDSSAQRVLALKARSHICLFSFLLHGLYQICVGCRTSCESDSNRI